MEKPKNPFQFPFDWEQFRQYFGGQDIFPGGTSSETTSWVESYVQDMLERTLPPATRSTQKPAARRYEVSESENKVTIKINVPEHIQPSNVKVYVKTDQVKLEGLADQPELIKLPAYVDPRICKALLKNRLIQLQMRKLPTDGAFRRIEVKTIL